MAVLVLFSPLIGAIIAGFFYKVIGESTAKIISVSSVFVSAVLSWFIFIGFQSGNVEKVYIMNWINSGSLNVSWGIRTDALTVVMLVVVNTVSLLVHLYSLGYMSHDKNWNEAEKYQARFFAYLSLFTFAMLVLVTSDNLLQLFFGWEGVGLASYLLIGFYYKKPSANAAAIKAFIVNRVGDFGFALGIFVIFLHTGSLYFDDLFDQLVELKLLETNFLGFNVKVIELAAFLLFMGAMGKSAQFLLHTWLPDAMEGPTPVSALIHAATMVTAGVFLVCRMSPLIENAPFTASFITIIGAITAFYAASVGLVQNDIKRIIAYSTCSQLGYMFVAAGVGFYQAAMFHLFTHAFFKALLFLGAGSVIHSMHHDQDVRNYGGLYKKIPYTCVFMVIGTLTITGVGFPFTYDIFHLPIGLSGFLSKDAIIEGAYAAQSSTGHFGFWVLIVAALFTSFYSWRLIFLTFFGTFRGKQDTFDSAKESSLSMLIPLFLLSVGAIFSGAMFYNTFVGTEAKQFFENAIFSSGDNNVLSSFHYVPWWVKILPFCAMIFGLALAVYFYLIAPKFPKLLVRQHYGLYQFLLNKWYFDEIYKMLFLKLAMNLGDFFWKKGDILIIDGLINKLSMELVPSLTKFYSRLQSGYLFHYAFGMIIGLTLLLTWFLVSS